MLENGHCIVKYEKRKVFVKMCLLLALFRIGAGNKTINIVYKQAQKWPIFCKVEVRGLYIKYCIKIPWKHEKPIFIIVSRLVLSSNLLCLTHAHQGNSFLNKNRVDNGVSD